MKTNTKAMIRNLQQFCDAVGWYLIQASVNVKCKEQVHAVILTKRGKKIELLVSKNERYYELLGDKKTREIDKKKLLKENGAIKDIV